MRRNCRFHGEVITIKNGKYGSMYVPKEESAPKEGKKPSGDNAFDRLREDIERIKDENIKRNRDNLDALYNIDMRNMSPSMKRLFASWSDGIKNANASVETIANSQEAVVKLVAQYDENIAEIQATANANSASISSIAKWQGEAEESIASIQQSASKNEASITQLVEVIGEDGETITASIKTAVINDESFIELVADRVTIEGTTEFVTRDELSDNYGSTLISGNLISLIMDAEDDNGTSKVFGTSDLKFGYLYNGYSEKFASLNLKADGSTTATTSRYALRIETYGFEGKHEYIYPAIKMYSVSNISIECDWAIYIGAMSEYCLLEAGKNTRIRASLNYEATKAVSSFDEEYDYVFATDGIYYRGVRIASHSNPV